MDHGNIELMLLTHRTHRMFRHKVKRCCQDTKPICNMALKGHKCDCQEYFLYPRNAEQLYGYDPNAIYLVMAWNRTGLNIYWHCDNMGLGDFLITWIINFIASTFCSYLNIDPARALSHFISSIYLSSELNQYAERNWRQIKWMQSKFLVSIVFFSWKYFNN